ncbi:hypothetical protein E4U43_008054 [Claviceps pusilla]|uniref:Mmc1 C-terminal domain-containing protein n=1 Tax=Claviceps pusilla TaxID=123648 RepID=A0A9P7SXL5_9HYPO|nr:hypothetical protein E4U43_008054 [Claviceps pusilla]
MASKSAVLPRSSHHRLLLRHTRLVGPSPSACPVCANASPTRPPRTTLTRAPRRDATSRRYLSSTPARPDPRAELESTLLELQKHSPNLINLSRLQLALQGLRQEAGSEIVRIAVLGLAGGPGAGPTARRVLRALLADPLQEEQPWERELAARGETQKPLVVRVGPPRQHAVSLKIEKETGLDEMHVSSPLLDGLNLEFLLMEGVGVPYGAPGETMTTTTTTTTTSIKAVEDAILVPAVEIPSAADRMSPISTPVHRALLVADGLSGAVSMTALLPVAAHEEAGSIAAAVQFEGLRADSSQLGRTTFDIIDVSLAEQGVRLFRQGPQHGMDYERLWFASNIPVLMDWLKKGASSSSAGETKPAVRKLIASLLQNTLSEAQRLEARARSRSASAASADAINGHDPQVAALNGRLVDWAQCAHSELQEELDLAFGGRRWRKLGWWQLFWRVDDVAMLTHELLSQRFMPTAEQELVYLTGRIAQLRGGSPAEYPQPTPSCGDAPSPDARIIDVKSGSEGVRAVVPTSSSSSSSVRPKWPGHIAFTRRYLQNETVPALQSLAQRLVLQSLGTSGVATSLAALLYMSSLSSTVYEAGAVAALGIVYGLGRVQKKWDAARTFWEGEVREEGRKAVRAAEKSVAVVLESHEADVEVDGAEGLDRTKELVARAEDALARMK